MDTLDRETVLGLANHTGWPSVTIYLPTNRLPTQNDRDVLALKNLLRSTEAKLNAAELRAPEVESLLAPIYSIARDPSAWREAVGGRAFFVAPDVFHHLALEADVPERATVADRFQIRPLLPIVDSVARFYVLALSKKRIRLLAGSGSGLQALDIGKAPLSLADALRFDDYERSVQFHSRTPASTPGAGRRAAVFHGHGGAPDVEKENLKRYFKQVDRGIHDLLHDDDAPLILAGVEYLLPIYREANSYPHLVQEAITGNPDDRVDSDIHSDAVSLLGPHFRAALAADLAELEKLRGTESSSADLSEILPAAVEGRVRVLFVPERDGVYGRFDPSSGRVDIHASAMDDDADLTDLVTAETLMRGGTVHAIAEETPTAAIFRY